MCKRKSLWGRHGYRGHAILVIVFAVFFVSGSVYGQESDYRLGPKDVISLDVYAGGNLEIDVDLTISAEGQITMPLVGLVMAAGRTVSELTGAVAESLTGAYFVDPQVAITVKEYHSLAFYISGAVVKAGLYEMNKEPTIFELISKAGGMVPDHGNSAFIIREENDPVSGQQSVDPIVVDLQRLLDKGDMSNNLRLKSGDVIHIPLATDQDQAISNIFVEGELNDPGVYPYRPGLTALSACIMAGGFNDYAAPNRARVIRKKGQEQEIIKVNLDAVKKGKAPDVELQPGDLVHVPDSWL